LQAGASAMMAMKRIALLRVKCDPRYRAVNSLALLVSEEIPDTGECEPEF